MSTDFITVEVRYTECLIKVKVQLMADTSSIRYTVFLSD